MLGLRANATPCLLTHDGQTLRPYEPSSPRAPVAVAGPVLPGQTFHPVLFRLA